jgi:hypothetical protein
MMPHGHSPERRRVQRVRLTHPLRAVIGEVKVFIIDISLRGVRILHQDPIGAVSGHCVVTAEWDARPLELHCTIARTAIHRPADKKSPRPLFHSGLQITRAAGVSSVTLRRLIEHHVELALDEQKANARGIPPMAAQSTQTGVPETFVRHEYVMGRWRQSPTALSSQPEQGFTIAASTPHSEVEMLRRAYEAATSADEMAMIRRMAALSVSSAEIVQARRYMP